LTETSFVTKICFMHYDYELCVISLVTIL